MSRRNQPQPTVDDILREFFAQQRQSRPIREDRSLRLEAHLRSCIEACGPDYISEEWWLMLEIERCFEPKDTFARLLPADFLLPPMHDFLSPEWLFDHGTDRLVQVNHSYRLVCWLCSSGSVNLRALRPSIIQFMIRHDELAVRPRAHKGPDRLLQPADAPITREDLP
ncbi:hypothetical protein [Arthrobacter sulfonylureivorans]|uniref:Uncharacterized protein n=1 Tax=Arthrobacter sulfonylureivorans TaxID=2486855 RepID=A0ABY3WB66_9MICC|nr:hypothetical protein [Arthrobacter sulfonylureivorans]UNK46702.1 hypothetical protein MNQ99_04930 [Arthrobacter sulfonylureivorans]